MSLAASILERTLVYRMWQSSFAEQKLYLQVAPRIAHSPLLSRLGMASHFFQTGCRSSIGFPFAPEMLQTLAHQAFQPQITIDYRPLTA